MAWIVKYIIPKTFHAQPSADAAFNLLRAEVEGNGAFVLLKGDLGSYHTAIDSEVFRGLAIADEVAPFIVINDRDARSAWSFTLLHECAHLILGQSGMRSDWDESSLERFCDNVAGEFLLPTKDLDELLDLGGVPQPDSLIEQQISEFAKERNRQSDGGPNYYVVRRHRTGQGLIQFTGRMMRSGAFSTSEAARVLGVKPTQVSEMLYSTGASK